MTDPSFRRGKAKNGRMFSDIFRLFRVPVSCMAATAAAFGYLTAHPRLTFSLAALALGCALLACACSAWNQAQEAALDSRMPRTANRPVAACRMARRTAVLLGLAVWFPSLLFLFLAGGSHTAFFGLLVPAVYNGIYTPLKPKNGFALLPGAFVGALPPVMGFAAAGEPFFSPAAVLLFSVYLLWQIPHFWLRVEKNRQEYAAAGLPLPPLIFASTAYRRLLGVWYQAYAAAVLLLPVFPLLHSPLLRAVTALAGIGLFTAGLSLLYKEQKGRNTPSSFHQHAADGVMILAALFPALDALLR